MKKAFCKMCVTVCGRFFLNEGGVAGYVNRMKVNYAAKWGVQIAGMIFQTRSNIAHGRKEVSHLKIWYPFFSLFTKFYSDQHFNISSLLPLCSSTMPDLFSSFTFFSLFIIVIPLPLLLPSPAIFFHFLFSL